MQPRKIYVVSDWHLGGRPDIVDANDMKAPGTSICRSINQIVRFIDFLTKESSDNDFVSELIINGDMVDFLAPDSRIGFTPVAWQANQEITRERLRQIADECRGEDGRSVFDALSDFLASGCELTVLLGNHDIELSLPLVRRELESLVGAKNGRFRFLFDGEAYSCGKLLVEHGNRYDSLNQVDFSLLRQERTLVSRGIAIDDSKRGKDFFVPPFGSEFVVREINPRLEQFAFINLLKPETEAVIPLLLALCPDSRRFLDLAFNAYEIGKSKFAGRLDDASQPRKAGRLNPSDRPHFASLDSFLTETLGEDAHLFLAGESRRKGKLSSSQDKWQAMREFSETGYRLGKLSEQVSDMITIFTNRSDKKRIDQLRTALRRIQDDTYFERGVDNGPCFSAAKHLINNTKHDVVVMGHTHFPKEIVVANGKYLNPGTWADMARLPVAIRSADVETSNDAISTFLKDMKTNNIFPYLHTQLNYVSAMVDSSGDVTATLVEFESGNESQNGCF